MTKLLLATCILLYSTFTSAACFDGLTTSTTVYSKIRGFYINRNFTDESQVQFVILDKANCVASNPGKVILAPTTIEHYYLAFKSSDSALYSLLLSAKLTNEKLEFRLGEPFPGIDANSIAYVISPADARSQ